MPINELDRRDDPNFDETLTGCHLVSSCSNIYHKDQFRQLLQHNFERHYITNKAPLSLSFDPSWLISNKGFADVIDDWMDYVLATYNDVYFVTELQVCRILYLWLNFISMSFRLSNGCRIPQEHNHWGILLNGRTNVLWRASHTALFLILAPSPPESYPEKQSAFTPALSAQRTTPGSRTLLEMGSLSELRHHLSCHLALMTLWYLFRCKLYE